MGLCVNVFAPQLHDQSQLVLAEQRLDAADDPGPAGDHDPLSHLHGSLTAEISGRDHLLTAAQLVPVVDRGHHHHPTYARQLTALTNAAGALSRPAAARTIAVVAGDERRPSAPARSPEQRLDALARANQVRSARAQLKRDLAAGSLKLARVLADPPPCAHTARVRDLLMAVPGIGRARAGRALAHCRIAEAKTVAGLSGRQRAELIDLLRR
jgi:hypothetical protein